MFARNLSRSLIAGVLSLTSTVMLQAQEPFAQDIVPTFSFTESYVEVLKSVTEDGYTETFPVPSNEQSKLTAAAKLSASGIDFGSFTAETPYTITIGDFSISGVLGDDPAYKPGATSIRIPVTDEDYETGETLNVGRAVISWDTKEINVSVAVQRPETYQAMAGYYIGSDEKIEDSTVCGFALGDHELSDRTVYVKGEASLRTKTIGSGWDAEEFELSTVSVSGSIDSIRPKVRIVGLAEDKIVDSANLDLSVFASDNTMVVDVQVQVNDEDYTWLYEEEDGKWAIEGLELNYGTNFVRVKAIDEDGNESLIEQTAVRYWAPLMINVSGKGSVTKGYAGTSLRAPGATLSVTATPADGYIFAGWTGSATSPSPTLGFEMQPGFVLTANFIPNPFTAVKGSYTGLLTPGTGSTGAGSLNVQLSGAGNFTAKVGLNGATGTLAGSFDSNGRFTGTLDLGTSTPLTVTLQLGLGDNANAISGTISDGTNTFSINTERSTYTAKNPAPQAGYYTVVLPAGDDLGAPQGDGYGTLNVSATGAATLTGALPDGTAFSYSGSISKDGTFGVYFAPYGGKGTIYGIVRFRDIPEVPGTHSASDVDGTLNWVKAPGATPDGFYNQGFSSETALIGSRYEAPRGKQRVISLANTTGNAKITLGDGGLEKAIEKSATINNSSRITVLKAEADKLKLNIVPANGLFSGSFVDSTGAQRKVNGVFLQKQNLGAGVFRGASTSGYISIAAP